MALNKTCSVCTNVNVERVQLSAKQRVKVLTADENLSSSSFHSETSYSISLPHATFPVRHLKFNAFSSLLWFVCFGVGWQNAAHPHKHIYIAIQMWTYCYTMLYCFHMKRNVTRRTVLQKRSCVVQHVHVVSRMHSLIERIWFDDSYQKDANAFEQAIIQCMCKLESIFWQAKLFSYVEFSPVRGERHKAYSTKLN